MRDSWWSAGNSAYNPQPHIMKKLLSWKKRVTILRFRRLTLPLVASSLMTAWGSADRGMGKRPPRQRAEQILGMLFHVCFTQLLAFTLVSGHSIVIPPLSYLRKSCLSQRTCGTRFLTLPLRSGCPFSHFSDPTFFFLASFQLGLSAFLAPNHQRTSNCVNTIKTFGCPLPGPPHPSPGLLWF